MKAVAKQALRRFGLEVRRPQPVELPVEFTAADKDIFHYVFDRRLTMVRPQRLIATINACKHAVLAELDGDFVECGVWRGGNSIAAKLVFEHYGSDKSVWLFDTFEGMTEPSEDDRVASSGEAASVKFLRKKSEDKKWCYASLESVRSNFAEAGADLSRVHFIQGDVAETLAKDSNLPDSISVLRLDTDWYDSTRLELQRLYPRLSRGGSLLIDDFGYWQGARKAVEEFLGALAPQDRPLLHYTDSTGRMAVKP
jgi:hypothetical protein